MWVLYNERKNSLSYALVYKRLSTNRLYGKAAERAVLTARLTGITVLQLQSPCIEYIYGKVEVKELEKS